MATDATFVTNVDLSNNELRNAKAQVLATDPTGVEGKFIYNSTDKQLKFYNGTAWVSGGAAVADLSGQASAFGQTAANGSASTAARSDHYHALPAHNAAAHSAIKLSDLAAPAANLAMGGFKLTGLAAGTANGDSLRYEQVIGQFLALTGGTLSGDLTIDSGLSSTELVVSNGGGSGASLEVRGGVSNIKLGSNDLSPAYWNIKHDHSDSKRFSIERWDGTAKVDTVLSIDNTTGAITSTKTLAMGNNKITGLADGTASTDAVTKQQLDTKANTTHTHAISDVTNLQTTLDAKAPLASPALTGTPTAPTAAAGTNNTQIATTAYVDAATAAASSGLDVKNSVRAASAGNIVLSGTQTIDGVALVAGNRVLVKEQTTGSANGIYVVAAGAWSRATDADTSAEVTTGMYVYVEEGTQFGGSAWVLSTTGTITLGTTSLRFNPFSMPAQPNWGDGLTYFAMTGFMPVISVGAGTGISVTADAVSIDTTVVARKYSVDLVDAAWTTNYYTVTHNLNTRDIVVSVREVAGSYGLVNAAVEANGVNTCRIYFATKPTTGTYRATVIA